MKNLILIPLITLAFLNLSFADQTKDTFQNLLQRHSDNLVPSAESFLDLTTIVHQNAPDLSDILPEIFSELPEGLLGLELKQIGQGEKQEALNKIFSIIDVPYFCDRLDENEDEFIEDSALCKKNTSKLLGDIIDIADGIYVLDLQGNYYGDWHEVVLILMDNNNFVGAPKSYILRFDIYHEI
jgi:hypothetical protein